MHELTFNSVRKFSGTMDPDPALGKGKTIENRGVRRSGCRQDRAEWQGPRRTRLNITDREARVKLSRNAVLILV
jgi:hypothetical protein